MEWTDEDQMQAKKDGWKIVKNGHSPFTVVKNTEWTMFETDEEALNHVTNMAVGGGSHLHFKALQCINCFGEKQPLGLVPKSIWMKLRLKDIKEAGKRYQSVGKEIPKEWIEEAGELALKLGDWE
jgi:hypothetical protein